MPPYQDSITALMGAPTTSDEERMAMSLRNDRAAGNLLGLSTIDQVSNLGTGMTKNTMVAAKQAGALKQSREKAALDREQRAETQAGLNEYRASMLAQASERQKALEENRLAQIKAKKDKLEFDRFKFDVNTEQKKDELGFDTERFLTKFKLNEQEFEYKKDYNALKLDQGNIKIANDYELNKAKLNLDIDKLAELERQFGVKQEGILTQHQADNVLKWAKFDWEKDEFGMERTDDATARLRRNYEFDVKTAQRRAMFNERLGFAAGALDAEMERHSDKMDRDAAKLAFSLIGKTGTKKTSMAAGTEKTYTDHASEAKGLLSMYSSYKPEYASQIPFSGQLATSLGTWADPIMDKDTKDLTGWWRTYKKDNILPERHKMFGAVLTPAEIKSWNQASINEGMTDYTIRKNLAWRERFIREKSAVYAGNALEAGASSNWVLRNYGSLVDGSRYITPAANDPLNSEENSETKIDNSIFTAQDQAEIDAINARIKAREEEDK